jgi:hypothetical protein
VRITGRDTSRSHRSQRAPARLGAFQLGNPTGRHTGVERTLRNTTFSAGESHPGDGNGRADQHDDERNITVPSTVLVTALDNGTLVLQGRPDGPRVYLSPADAAPLTRELAVAFGGVEVGPRGHPDDAR